MWDRARERAGITDSVGFKDLRALGATDALKAGEGEEGNSDQAGAHVGKDNRDLLEGRVAEASGIDVALPCGSGRIEPSSDESSS